jgi:hypothetical protein
MTPALQRWVAIALVIAAVAYLSGHAWRTRRAAAALRQSARCGPGCGCGS